ncbi:MAG TPA: porin family protein [Gemmatimonadales bacterium]|jgi:hypothetical protein|nr:porin family protein [Gemmatimonadales bacterium]
MRKTLLTLAAAAMTAAPLSAQVMMGVEGGFASSNISASGTSGTFTTTSRSGFAAGISIAGRLGQGIHLGPDVLYIEKGFQENSDGVTGTFKLNYVEVPLLLHLSFGTGMTRVFVLGGPAIAFKVSCSADLSNGSGGSIGGDCTSDSDSDIKSTDVSVMFGAGVMIDDLSLSARYDLGLTNVLNNASNDLSYKNHTLLILAGFRLGR